MNAQTLTAGFSQIKISTGALELAKWVALLLMAADHINRFLFDSKLAGVFETARIAFPLFGFVLAYNLARPGVDLRKVQDRLFWFGLATQPFYQMAWNGYNGLNILLTFFVAVMLVDYWQTSKHSLAVKFVCAGLIFSVSGLFVEYNWFGLLYILASFALVKLGGVCALAVWIAALALGLTYVNTNAFALGAAPIIFSLPFIDSGIPRTGRFFYWFYFAHMVAIGMFVFLHAIK